MIGSCVCDVGLFGVCLFCFRVIVVSFALVCFEYICVASLVCYLLS